MKKIITLSLSFIIGLSVTNAQTTFSDDFESYVVGSNLGPQSPNWRTWSGLGGGTDDVKVVSTDNHTAGGSKSIYFSSTSASGGPQDCVLPFGTAPLTTGTFTFTAWFKVPTTKNAYFNFQGSATFGNLYTLNCFMKSDSTLSFQDATSELLTSTYPVGAWFEMKIVINLNTNTGEVFIDGISKGTYVSGNTQVYAVDIYPTDASSKYWVDDVSYSHVPYVVPTVNAAATAFNTNVVSPATYLDGSKGIEGQQRNIAVSVRNLGSTTINSFDISVAQNGGAAVMQNVASLSLAPLATKIVNITSPFTLVAGTNTFAATVSNVNGAGADGDLTDNTTSGAVTAAAHAVGKMVLVEEGTGTWCGWCVRGAVYMDMIAKKYDGYVAGIAVHNGDPMTVTDYDAAIGNLISGYPTALVDRGTGADPSALEPDILQDITVAPAAFLANGATYNSTTRVLTVSVTTTFQQAVSGDYRIACALAQDSVTGTASGYSQTNYYQGGSNGVMGGFEALANPVPAASMKYNHVARVITPDFNGLVNSYPSSVLVNDVYTHNFTYTLPATWNANKIHIIGMMVNPNGKIDNVSSTTIAQAVTNGLVLGTAVGTVGVTEFVAPDAQFNLYPNPTKDRAILALNLVKESMVTVSIYSVNGALVAKKDYGKLTGAYSLPIETSNFDAGMYFINLSIDGKSSMIKLVKE